MLSSASCLGIPSVYVLCLRWETRFQISTKLTVHFNASAQAPGHKPCGQVDSTHASHLGGMNKLCSKIVNRQMRIFLTYGTHMIVRMYLVKMLCTTTEQIRI
jgi:hypothetical protein